MNCLQRADWGFSKPVAAFLLFYQALVEEYHLAGNLAGEAHFVGDQHGPALFGERTDHVKHFLYHFGSSAEVGSSNRITLGCMARVRAMAARCCWPPESCAG